MEGKTGRINLIEYVDLPEDDGSVRRIVFEYSYYPQHLDETQRKIIPRKEGDNRTINNLKNRVTWEQYCVVPDEHGVPKITAFGQSFNAVPMDANEADALRIRLEGDPNMPDRSRIANRLFRAGQLTQKDVSTLGAYIAIIPNSDER